MEASIDGLAKTTIRDNPSLRKSKGCVDCFVQVLRRGPSVGGNAACNDGVYTLVHDNRRSVSLLKQLGIKGSLRFVSTENSSARLGKSTWGIVRAVFGQDASGPFSRYEPRLDKNPEDQHRLQFSRWWEQVFSLRDQEGGSHFDPELTDPNYIKITRTEISDLIVKVGTEPERTYPSLGLELASMRQIAWELLETLKDVNIQA